MRVSHILPVALVVGLAVLLAGCGREEGVKAIDVPKTTESGKKADVPAKEYRMLGAMFPADNPAWFFKFSGPSDEIAKYEGEFDELLKSVKVTGADSLDFTAPKGWQKGPGREGFVKVYATATPPDGKYELTITQSGGGVKGNLGRWVGQIGLKPGDDDLAKYTKPIETTSGLKGLRVDLTGPTNPATKRNGPMMPAGHP